MLATLKAERPTILDSAFAQWMLVVVPGVDFRARRTVLFRVEPVSRNQTSVLDWEIERYRWRQPDCVRQINYP